MLVSAVFEGEINAVPLKKNVKFRTSVAVFGVCFKAAPIFEKHVSSYILVFDTIANSIH